MVVELVDAPTRGRDRHVRRTSADSGVVEARHAMRGQKDVWGPCRGEKPVGVTRPFSAPRSAGVRALSPQGWYTRPRRPRTLYSKRSLHHVQGGSQAWACNPVGPRHLRNLHLRVGRTIPSDGLLLFAQPRCIMWPANSAA